MEISKAVEHQDAEKSKQWPQFLAVFCGSLLAIGSGFHFGWPSPSVLKMKAGDLDFPITVEEISYIVMIGPLGYVVGSPLSSLLLDLIGRKKTLLVLSIPQIIPWLLIALSTNVPTLYVARFITGIADGALFTTLPVYMCEVLEPKIRGVVGTSHSTGILIGLLLINVYGSYLSIRTAAYVSLVVPVLFLCTFVWMPDSPYFLLMKGRDEEAKRSLQSLRKMKNVDQELANLTKDVQRQTSEPGQLRDIFVIKTNLKAFLILLGLRTFQQLSGVSVLGFYTQLIFEQAGGDMSPTDAAIVCAAAQVIFILFCSSLVDKFGRKPILIFSSIGSALILTIIGVYFVFQQNGEDMSSVAWLPVVAIITYNMVSACGFLMMPNLMAGEMLSVSIKSKALGITNIYLGICMGATSKLFQFLGLNLGMHAPFFTFGACCAVSTFFCYFIVPETKGKTLEEIQQNLKGNKPEVKQANNIIALEKFNYYNQNVYM